jgi:hypothetical protein
MLFIINKLKSLFMAFGKSVKSFLQNIWDLFRQWFHVAEQAIKDNVHTAVIVTENIKKFIDNPVGDFLLTVIDEKVPGDLTGKVKELLPKVLMSLQIIDRCKDLEEEEVLKCIAHHMQDAPDNAKDAFYHSLAVTLAKELSDGKVSFSDMVALVEWYFRHQVKK